MAQMSVQQPEEGYVTVGEGRDLRWVGGQVLDGHDRTFALPGTLCLLYLFTCVYVTIGGSGVGPWGHYAFTWHTLVSAWHMYGYVCTAWAHMDTYVHSVCVDLDAGAYL